MYDVKELKDKITNEGIALSKSLEERVLNDEMTEQDHAFISRTFGTLRNIKKDFGNTRE